MVASGQLHAPAALPLRMNPGIHHQAGFTPHSRCGHLKDETNLLLLARFERRTVQSEARSLYGPRYLRPFIKFKYSHK